jgi:hypothetical protein
MSHVRRNNLTFMHVDTEYTHSLICKCKREKYEKEKKDPIMYAYTIGFVNKRKRTRERKKESELLKESPLWDVMDKASSLFINRQNNR